MFVTIAVIVVFSIVLVAAARLGSGSVDSFVGLFSNPNMPPRPYGTQEDDLPPFRFR